MTHANKAELTQIACGPDPFRSLEMYGELPGSPYSDLPLYRRQFNLNSESESERPTQGCLFLRHWANQSE